MNRAYDPYEDGFAREQFLEFARVGVCPPPYAGDSKDPRSVQFHIAAQQRWQAEPDLRGGDEGGGERQMGIYDARVKGWLECYVDRDPADFGRYHRRA